MKSMTIHGLDDALDNLIREKAKIQGMSLNKTIKYLLEESLGLKESEKNRRKNDFLDLFGIWTKSEAKIFCQSIADFEKVDPEDWD